MKSWIARIRISAALDAGQQPSAWLRRKRSGSEGSGPAEQEMIALDAALKEAPPRVQAPDSLHSSIMRAVRAADRSAAARPQPALMRWLPVPAMAALLLLGALWFLHSLVRTPVQDTQSLAATASALQFGNQMVKTMPAAVVAPLSDELNRLNRDLDNTAQFLLASLP